MCIYGKDGLAYPYLLMSMGRLRGVGALWDCVPRVTGCEDGCAGGGVPLGAVLALSWCGELSLGGKHSVIISY